jgi:hypothetical protein
VIFLNPVPTAAEVRSSWSRSKQTVRPVFRLLRAGAYLGFGLGLALGLRALRDLSDGGDQPSGSASSATALAERGERTARDILAVPAVSRTTGKAQEVSGVLASRGGRVLDEAHDSVEEAYGRFYLGLDRLRRALLPAWLRRQWE